MATRNSSSKSNVAVETMDKLPSNTLKRNPKMELSKSDLLKLLSYLEGEVQAREIVIATLKTERVKQLLYQAKYGHFALNDPFAALQRDSYGALGPAGACDEAAIKTLYNNQLGQLENLVLQHRRAQQRLREHLREVVGDLEEERQKHALDTAEGDDVTYMLEKERERLRQEVEAERQQKKLLETELRRAARLLAGERAKQKQIVVLLLAERKLLVSKMLEEHGRREQLQQILMAEKGRMADVVDGLEEESQKSLRMEADMERQAADFDAQRASLENALERERARVRTLEAEAAALRARLREPTRLGDAGDAASPSPTSALRVVTSCSPPPPPPPPVKPDNPGRCPKVNGAESPYSPGGLLLSCCSPQAGTEGRGRPAACVSPCHPDAVKDVGGTQGTSSQARGCARALASPPQAPQPPKKPPPTATVCCSSPGTGVGAGTARGAPPPVPPNKPVLTGPALQKKEAIVRTLVPGADADARSQKGPARSSCSAGQPRTVYASSVREEGADDAADGKGPRSQELADFQRMFVSMRSEAVSGSDAEDPG